MNARRKIETLVLMVMDKSIYEKYLSQPFPTNNKQFKTTVTFLTGFNGVCNVRNKKNNFFPKINQR